MNNFIRNDLNSIDEGEKEKVLPEARSDYDYLANHQPSYASPSDFQALNFDENQSFDGFGDINLEK